MRVEALLITLALLGCGNSTDDRSGDGDVYGAYVAKTFDQDCRRAKAPTPKLANELDRLCTCSTNRIRSVIHHGDSDDVVNRKIAEIANSCEKQVYPKG